MIAATSPARSGENVFKSLSDLGFAAQNSIDSEFLVVKIEDRFDHMRKRPVPNIVKQRRYSNRGLGVIRNVVAETQLRDHSRRKMKCPERMCEPGMLSRLIGKIGQAELAYSPQTLKFGSVDQRHDQASLGRVSFYTDDIMDRITVYSLCQFTAPGLLERRYSTVLSFH